MRLYNLSFCKYTTDFQIMKEKNAIFFLCIFAMGKRIGDIIEVFPTNE